MVTNEIDLSSFKGKGVTLNVSFALPQSTVDPFVIFITSADGKTTYYYRKINTGKVQINLPVHSDKVIFNSLADYPIKSVIQRPIQINKIVYKTKTDIIQPRKYPFEQIRTDILPIIKVPMQNPDGSFVKNWDGRYIMQATKQPARFMPQIGLKQLSAGVMHAFPEPVQEFIIEHEDGHYYYGRTVPPPDVLNKLPVEIQQEFAKQVLEDEEGADDYALHQLINKGYNYSGVFNALTDFLPDTYITQERVKKMYNTIQGLHNKNLLQ